MPKKLRLLVLVSGGGTNLKAILDGIAAGSVTNVEPVGVVSSSRKVKSLEIAAQAGIPALCVSPGDFADREGFHTALLQAMDSFLPDLVALAGFLVRIPPRILQTYGGRLINIHPSLIPSFCGTGCYGLKVHEKALERGVKLTGATVHFVDEGMDEGPIISQRAVAVEEGDTPAILQRRVMEQAEWVIFPKAIDDIANGRIVLKDGKVESLREGRGEDG
ncbi:MAG: phosphoribosylglycinamide formyltransferase [Clostridium sp.]|nr:phosphoribosylglycinamide formyltransferase [Clostridium sp.]